ncbi:cytochrome P450 [Bradyrhizobium sp. LM2.7]
MSTAPRIDIDPASFWADPYPMLARMRKEAPIAFVPQLGSTLLTCRDDISISEKQIDVFSSRQPAGLMNRLMGHNMMRKDGEAHQVERRAMFPTVSPKTVKAHWTALFQAHADRIIDAIEPGRVDFMRDFALPFSGECLKSITGLTNIGFGDMDAWSQGMIEGIANYTGDPVVEARCHAATSGIDAAIDDMLPVISKHPDQSILGVLVASRHANGKRARQRQACDLRRPERAAQGHRRHNVGAAEPPRSARSRAQRRGVLAPGVRGICPLDLADRHVAAADRKTVEHS